MSETRYVIIGNGVAGVTAAQELRRLDRAGQITIIGDEGEPFYYRGSLSEWISGDTSADMLPARTPEFYGQMGLHVVTGRVIHVDPQAQTAALEDGAVYCYDRLLIASGAAPRRVALPGLADFKTFRTLADAREIRERLGCCGRLVILGGGVLGLELAGAVRQMGIEHVAIVQLLPYVGAPLLDQSAAEWLQPGILADGVELFLDDTVERVDGQRAVMKSGKSWEFDLFVQSIGVTPVFPDVPGIEIGRGIRIDDGSRTNMPDIFAAGDCTETWDTAGERWRTTRIWLDCARQAKTAACNMAGRDDLATHRPFFNASVIYRSHYAFVGDAHGAGGVAHIWKNDRGYRKIRVVDGRLAGAMLLGERHGMLALLEAIGQNVEQYGTDIARPDFPFNELTGPTWDYLFY